MHIEDEKKARQLDPYMVGERKSKQETKSQGMLCL